jgi:hypothetical protein
MGCVDCVQSALEEFQRHLDGPDGRYLFGIEDFGVIRATADRTFDDLRTLTPTRPTPQRRQVTATQVTAVPSQAFTRSPPHPIRVVGSAFNSSAPMTNAYAPPTPSSQQSRLSPRPTIRDRLSAPEKVGVTLSQHQRTKVAIDDSDLLVEGFHQHGSKWETIRKNFPPLRKYTGVQLKDHYRHIMGRDSNHRNSR